MINDYSITISKYDVVKCRQETCDRKIKTVGGGKNGVEGAVHKKAKLKTLKSLI